MNTRILSNFLVLTSIVAIAYYVGFAAVGVYAHWYRTAHTGPQVPAAAGEWRRVSESPLADTVEPFATPAFSLLSTGSTLNTLTLWPSLPEPAQLAAHWLPLLRTP